MVKNKLLPALLLSVLFLSGCNNDLLGLFGSNNLNDRLKEKDNLKFLNSSWTNQALSPSLGGNYKFIVLTDTHIENKDAFGMEKIKDAVASDNEIEFIVVCGDITQNGKKEDIEKFKEISDSLAVPCYPVLGNHDIFFDNWSDWKNIIGSTRYKIAEGGTTLLIMDSANGFFGKDQLDWLEKEVKNAKKAGDRVFVFSHCNLFVKSLVDIQQFTDTREVARICSVLKNRCDAMFMGHTHKRLKREAGGVHYITVDGFKATGYYCLVTVDNAVGISWEFKKL